MNIVHLTHGKVNPFGVSGISRTVYYLAKYQGLMKNRSQIWSVDDHISEHISFERDDFVKVELFPRAFLIRPVRDRMVNYLSSHSSNVDIFHFHLPWLIDKIAISDVVRKLRKPYIVTTQGTYTRNSLRFGKVKKVLAKYAYELRFLNRAAAIHTVTHVESSALREFGVRRTPIFVIPNGIELDEVPENLDHDSLIKEQRMGNKTRFLWIGSFRPEKNLKGLILAVSLLPKDIRGELAFVIVGPRDEKPNSCFSYSLKLAKKCDVHNVFHFVGPLYGKDKYKALAAADVYVHPSWSEGCAFAILDAMACGKPCLITRTSNVAYLHKYDFFAMVEPYPEDIARGIMEMLNRRGEWNEMGKRARHLIESELTWQKIASEMLDNYELVIKHYQSSNE